MLDREPELEVKVTHFDLRDQPQWAKNLAGDLCARAAKCMESILSDAYSKAEKAAERKRCDYSGDVMAQVILWQVLANLVAEAVGCQVSFLARMNMMQGLADWCKAVHCLTNVVLEETAERKHERLQVLDAFMLAVRESGEAGAGEGKP